LYLFNEQSKINNSNTQAQQTFLAGDDYHFTGRTWQTVYPIPTQLKVNQGIYIKLDYTSLDRPEITNWNYSCIMSVLAIDEKEKSVINSSELVIITGSYLPFNNILYMSGITLTLPSSGCYHLIVELSSIAFYFNTNLGVQPIVLTNQNIVNTCDKYIQVT
jgi:hypothetical protein